MLPIKINLPEHFLEEEERCGFTVSKEMKAVWAVEMDLLIEFQRVCKKFNIKWWMDGGSLLGTVRHGGFIPWDDDIDVIIMRNDYDKLCRIAPTEFSDPYFFQTELTDHGSMRGHAQLRNSKTTAILKSEEEKHYRFNQGIFIDIFPLDSIPDDKTIFEKQIKSIIKFKQICYKKRDYINSLQNVKRRNLLLMVFFRFKGFLYNSILYKKKGNWSNYVKFENEASKYKDVSTTYVGNIILGTFKNNWAWLRSDYRKTVYMPFEFMNVPIPSGYESRLASQYGDWKTFVVGNSLHGGVIFDPYNSYKVYNR